MADGWIIDPKNPNRATWTDPDGQLHEIFRKTPVQPKAPAVEYERNPNGYVPQKGARMGPAKGQEATVSQPEMSWSDRFGEAYDRATSMSGTGEIGALARGIEDLFNIDDRFQQGTEGGTSQEREDLRDANRVAQVRKTRSLWAAMDEADPAWRKDGNLLGNVSRFSANLLGDIAGNANPTYLIGGGSTAAERMAVQGAANAGIDAALQGNEMRTGIQDEFDPFRTAMQFLAGTVIQGGGEVAAKGGRALADVVNPKTPELDFDSSLHPEETIVGDLNPTHSPADDIMAEENFRQEMQDALIGGATPEQIDAIYARYGKAPEGRPVSSIIGADAEFRPADEAFTDSLVTGKPVEPAAPDSVLRDPVEPEVRDFGLGTEETFGRLDGKAGGQDVRTYDTNELQELIKRRTAEGAFDGPAPEPKTFSREAELDYKAKNEVLNAEELAERSALKAPAVSKADVESHVSEATKSWKNAPEFEIVDRVDDIADPEIRAAVDDPSVIGFYGPDGKVRIVSGNLRDKAEIAPALFHESLGHHGLRQKFGEDLDNFMTRMYENSPELRKSVDDWVAGPGRDYGDVPMATKVEEVLAKMSEDKPLTQSLMDRIKDFLKSYARKAGVNLEFSPREIRSILASAHDAVTKGTGTAATPDGFRFIKSGRGKTDIRESLSGFKDKWSFKHTTPDGEEIVGTYSYNPDKGVAYGLNIGGFEGPNAFGPRTIRELAEALKEKHPGIKSIEGTRVSGARTSSVDNPKRFENVKVNLNRYMRRETEYKGEPDFDINNTKELNDSIGELAKGVDVSPQSIAETLERAAAMGITPSKVANRRRIHIEDAPHVITAMAMKMDQQDAKVRELARRINAGEDSSEMLARAVHELAVLGDIVPNVMRMRSAAGRTLNAFAALSRDGKNPAQILERLKEFSEQGSPTDKDSILKLLRKIEETNDPDAAAKAARDAFGAKTEDFLFSLWYNIDLLSRPSTQLNNIVGTAEHLFGELASTSLATIPGLARKAIGNKDRVAVREVLARLLGMGIGAVEGLKNAPQAFKTGMPVSGIGKEAYRPIPLYEMAQKIQNKPLGTLAKGVAGAAELPSRMMAVTDEFFRSMAMLSDYYGTAFRTALKNKDGLEGSLAERFYSLRSLPTEEMKKSFDLTPYSIPANEFRNRNLLEAKQTANRVTFRDASSPYGKAIEDFLRPKLNDDIPLRTVKFGLRTILPFVRMGDAMTRAKLRYAPIVGMLDRYNKADWKAGGARRDLVIGKMTLGIGLGYLALQQAMSGDRTGEGPTDIDRRMELEAGGWKPNALRNEDGSYTSVQNLGPINTMMNTVASAYEKYNDGFLDDKSYMDTIKDAVFALTASFSKDAGTENLFRMIGGVNDPEDSKSDNALAGLISSFASPGSVQAYNQNFNDTAIRSTAGDKTMEGRIAGRVKSVYPGLSEELPQRSDIYGRLMERRGGLEGFLTGNRRGLPENDPTVKELQRLAKTKTTGRALIDQPDRTLRRGSKEDKKEKKLTDQEFQKYTRLSGFWITGAVKSAMESGEWKAMDDKDRLDYIAELKKEARAAAREYLFPEFYEDEEDAAPLEVEESPYVEEVIVQ